MKLWGRGECRGEERRGQRREEGRGAKRIWGRGKDDWIEEKGSRRGEVAGERKGGEWRGERK